jgi:hypothetical protein
MCGATRKRAKDHELPSVNTDQGDDPVSARDVTRRRALRMPQFAACSTSRQSRFGDFNARSHLAAVPNPYADDVSITAAVRIKVEPMAL